MGKIVKFCSSCDEGFAEKFGFCPNCGSGLQAFEMNPLEAKAPLVEEVAAAPVIAESFETVEATPEPVAEAAPEPVVEQAAASFEEPILEIEEPEAVTEPQVMAAASTEEIHITEESEIVDEPSYDEPAPKVAAAAASAFVQTTPIDIDRKPFFKSATFADHDAFRVTIVEERAGKTRNGLLLGATGFMLFALMTGMVYSLFSKDLGVGSIGEDSFLASLIDVVPMPIEEEIKKQNKDEGGGGGGGGRDEKDETTKGDLADQTPKPVRPPDAKTPRLENPSLVLPPPSTEGNQKFKKENDRWGDPNGRFTNFSNGTGTGGGQGSGTGTGQGSGRGTGAGSGTGSGYGGGLGNGNGNGRGSGDDGDSGPPPEVRRGVTQGLKILSKPRAGYTDAARQNNIQGTVILRVTFLGSGQIGSISPIKGLPNGLTEQAIAAARRMSFEPAKTNGVGQSVTKQVEYSFSIY
ncbi:MAG: TonB family protein [Pyrinomonadaceae bacterium]